MTDACPESPQAPDVLDRLAPRIARVLQQRTGLLPHIADPITQAVIEALRVEMRGERFYVPQESRIRRQALRVRLQADALDGLTIDQLCRRHHISRRTYYRVMREDASAT